jgi:hypothetical protein
MGGGEPRAVVVATSGVGLVEGDMRAVWGDRNAFLSETRSEGPTRNGRVVTGLGLPREAAK